MRVKSELTTEERMQWLGAGPLLASKAKPGKTGKPDALHDLSWLIAHAQSEIGGMLGKVNDASSVWLGEAPADPTPEELDERRRHDSVSELLRVAHALRRQGSSAPMEELVRRQPSCVNMPLPPWRSTLLHVAAAQGDLPLCKLLIHHGARACLNSAGQTPGVVALMSHGPGELHTLLKALQPCEDDGGRDLHLNHLHLNHSASHTPETQQPGSLADAKPPSPNLGLLAESKGPLRANELEYAETKTPDSPEPVPEQQGEPEQQGKPCGDLMDAGMQGAIALFELLPDAVDSAPAFPGDHEVVELEPGERVMVISVGRDGTALEDWALVMKEATGEEGFAPLTYLEFDEDHLEVDRADWGGVQDFAAWEAGDDGGDTLC
jgi:hypothetical protein